MITFNEALRIVGQQNVITKTEECVINEALNKFLVEEVRPQIDNPPFDKSAMDGWAIISDDNSESFNILETIGAGDSPVVEIEKGQCCKIMTGAILPKGADQVIRVEYTESDNIQMRVIKEETNNNVIRKGENFVSGNILLAPQKLYAQDIAILAAFGIDKVTTYKTPEIGVINSGSELIEPGSSLEKGKIFNSNGYGLKAQIDSVNCKCNYYGIAKDDQQLLKKEIKKGMEQNDILLITGGVSMGDYDFIPGILKEMGVNILFHKIAVKPGKPVLFGEKDGKYVFGLPGNPVATFFIFELLIKPLISQFQGQKHKPQKHTGILKETVKCPKSGRISFRPVYLYDDEVHLVKYGGSSHLTSLSEANGIILLEPGKDPLEKGSRIIVQLF